MKIRYVLMGGRNGYAEFGRYFVAALHAAGHEVTCQEIPKDAETAETLGPKAALVKSLTRAGHPDVNIVNAGGGDFARYRVPGILNLGFTMFEASRVTPRTVEQCNAMDGILVPAAFCAEVYRSSGVTAPIHVVHCGIFQEDLPKARPTRSKDYRFLSIFQWSDRKNPETLLDAYLSEFHAADAVSLTIKTYPFGPMAPIASQVDLIRKAYRDPPPIRLITEPLSPSELWKLHLHSDCHVSAHHGEGWGMSLMDAMALGKPVIATGYGGNTDFMTADNSYLLPFEMGTVKFQTEGMRPHYDRTMQWANVDEKALRASMRHVFEHQIEARARGERARSDISSRLNPSASVRMIEDAVESVRKGWRPSTVPLKTCMVQCASGPFLQSQQRVHEWHADYASRHGIDYLCHLGRVPSQSSRHPIWDRLPLLESALSYGYELVVWVDSDALIVDPSIDLREAAREFQHVGMSRHPMPFNGRPWHYNNGVMFFRNTPEAQALLRRTDELGPIPGSTWKMQASLLTVNEDLDVIEQVDDRWNSTDRVNESNKPVIRAWHGQGEPGRQKLREALQAL